MKWDWGRRQASAGRAGSVSKLMLPFPLLLAGVLISLSLRLSLASFRGKYSVHKYENKPIIDPWTEFVSIRFYC